MDSLASFFPTHGHLLWLIAALALSACELVTGGFVLLWFAVGAAAAALASWLGASFNTQLMVLGVTALSLFAGSRTIFRTVFMARRAPFHLAAGRDRIGMDGVRISISSGAQSTRFVTRAKLSVSLTLLRAHG